MSRPEVRSALQELIRSFQKARGFAEPGSGSAWEDLDWILSANSDPNLPHDPTSLRAIRLWSQRLIPVLEAWTGRRETDGEIGEATRARGRFRSAAAEQLLQAIKGFEAASG